MQCHSDKALVDIMVEVVEAQEADLEEDSEEEAPEDLADIIVDLNLDQVEILEV